VRKATLIFMLIMACCVCAGCSNAKEETEKRKNLDFTVVPEEEIPEELKTLITEKYKEAFEMAYNVGEELYIITGYGLQPTGGYSISVDQLYLTEDSICIDTNLHGPEKEEEVEKKETYPYIVVKTEYIDKSVVFQ